MEAVRGITICVQEDGLLSVQKAGCLAAPAREPATFEQVKAEGTFMSIAAMQQKLNDLHLLVQSGGVCVMVEGCGGCGKSALLRAYASARGYHSGENLVVIHLGEQIDGKMLLGTFTCTTNPGEFVWLPGVLTKAVAGGKWVIMEDVDAAPPDVLSLLLPLVKSWKLMIPGYAEPLKAAPGFRLFLTRSLTIREVEGGYSQCGGLLSILRQHSSLLSLPPLMPEEVKQIVEDQYPNLRLLSDRLVQTSSSLTIQLRCILKLCERVSPQVYGGRISSVEDLMLELVDCFGGHLPAERRLTLALELRSLCGGFAKEKVEQLCTAHKPSLQISLTTVTVGRAYLPRIKAEDSRLCYAHTQGSLRLLESVCRCVQMNEPVLLVGETGVGKTATVNYLAKITGNKLVVVNMSQQTDSTDLLGGFKPVQVSQLVAPVKEEFEHLFHATFSVKQNAQFLASIQVCFAKQQWKKLFKLMSHSLESALKRLKGQEGADSRSLTSRWNNLKERLTKLRKQMNKTQAAFAFAFVEGALVEAVTQGWWILLDEINLASAETLQCLSSLLEGPEGSFLLTEKGDLKMVERHPNFRLFCCMNPATDIGKKAMPQSVRSRFTEFFVDELQSTEDLRLLVLNYLKDISPNPSVVDGIIKLYRSTKELAQNRLQDGTGRKPHYSLRSLCRALVYAANNYCGMFLRSLYEGFCMSFFTEVCPDHHHLVATEIQRCLNISDSCTSGRMSCPKDQHCVQVEGFWLPVGCETPVVPGDYILTGSVKRNLKNLARVVSARQHPVLLQGPTSAGKTSLIQYLARVTGHRCLRINNHEHTDLQEYVGMYTATSSGQLIFQEGVLVDAMRNGYWIILDELNLAPTDVLEALNRVLDDNRELFIPETQELVKAHSHFLLFGAQNPPGLYGGRKVLSRAFRNRFIELHFDDIPAVELVTILHQGSQLPQSYAKKMVAVMKELQQRRSYSGVFAGKYGLITLRDLFRWAERYRKSVNTEKTFYDWEQQLAEDGFMLLGGRLRNPSEEAVIQEVIQKHFKRPITPSLLFGHDGGSGSLTSRQTLQLLRGPLPQDFNHLVWTPELLKMAVLLYRALQFDEPVLLVGNTGCGKTTLCHLFASLLGRDLSSINCHMHTEGADFLGGLRPVRTRTDTDGGVKAALFEWTDGIIVQAMKSGSCVLIDEISLAEDAVLERLNSVLEPQRKLLVAERSRQKGEVYEIVAQDGFALMATMNPGGDYGKKELSPALRNRFVEIWCPSASGREGYMKIIEHNLVPELVPPNSAISWSTLMMDFIEWLKKTVLLSSSVISIRDLLAWVKFMNTMTPRLTLEGAYYHGAHLVFLDALACGDAGDGTSMRTAAMLFLLELMDRHGVVLPDDRSGYTEMECTHEGLFGIPPFYIERGSLERSSPIAYTLEAPGPRTNAFRILRAMQLGKPLLLEGAPGVGKTSLVTALAQASGHPVTRINLSEHTDVSDLFGSDLPVEGGKGVNFAWRDGPFLKALKNGDWILLDEMNLASQSVLEGLNACLDHRGEVYIPELGMAFKVQLGTRLFACQNPLQQGGGRKGLPKSFLNRFTQVYVDVLSSEDLLFIVSTLYPSFECNMLQKMITFNAKVEALVKLECGNALWEFNLRDLLRWCELIFRHQHPTCRNPGLFVDLIYCRRLRDSHLRSKVCPLFVEVFECPQEDQFLPPLPLGAYFHVTTDTVQVGHTILHRESYIDQEDNAPRLLPLYCQMPVLEALMTCVQMRWMAILVGGSCSGKCSTVRTLASLTGHKLLEFPMNSDTDVTELLGGFEQVNFSRHCSNLASMALDVTRCIQGSLMRDLAADPVYHESYAALDSLSKKLSTGFSPAMCLEDCSPQEVTVLCKELKTILLHIGDISSELNTTLPYRISEVLMQVEELSRKVQEMDTTGQFEWVDSVLVRALKYGHWLLISNANFCSPSVLDRLNPLLEPNGVLSIDERGIVGDKVPTITPHPNFRLFLSMNPLHGEISRAMRNRGIEISILPEESLGILDNHHSDWDSLLSVQRHCDRYTSCAILQMCSSSAGVRVNQALQAAKCYQLLHNSQQGMSLDWLAKACQLVGIPEESCSLNMSVRNGVRMEAVTVNDYVLHSDSTTAYRDIVSVLTCLNPALSSKTNCSANVNFSPLKLSAALDVFVTNSTLEDHQSRVSLLEHLLSLVHLQPWANVEVNAAVTALAMVVKHPDARKFVKEFEEKHGFPVSSLTALVNPHICCMAEEDRSLLFTFTSRLAIEAKRVLLLTLVKQHANQVCFGYEKSVLQLSHDIHTGVLPLQLSTNHSFMYIYPFLCALLSSLQGVAAPQTMENTETSMETLHLYFDWITMFVRTCMAPGCSLSTTAVAWSLLLRECVKGIIPFIEITSEFQLVQSLLKGLQGLEDVVKQGKLFATVRKAMGHPRRTRQQTLNLKNTAQAVDRRLRQSKNWSLPFLMLKDQSVVEKRRTICLALSRAHLAEWVDSTDGMEFGILEQESERVAHSESTEERQRDNVPLATAIQPIVHCLKRVAAEFLLTSFESWNCPLAQVGSLLDYCLQLSAVGVLQLGALIVLHGSCCLPDNLTLKHDVHLNILESLLPGFLDGCCSGLGMLEPTLLAEDVSGEAVPLLVESCCSRMCFGMLSPYSCGEDSKSDPAYSVTLSIGNHLSKMEELKALVQHLWLHGCSSVYSPRANIILELDLHKAILRRLIRATQHAVQGHDLVPQEHSSDNDSSADPFPESISGIRGLGDKMYSSSVEWSVLEQHLVSAHDELTSMTAISQQDGFVCSTHSELSVLHSLNCAKVHLGIALSLVLCPPPVDPVALDLAHHLCIYQLTKQTQCLLEAWDHHYEVMVGKGIRQLLDVDDDTSEIKNPGVAPNVVSLLKKRKLWTDRLHSIPPPCAAMTHSEEKQYSSLVHLCTDIMETVCAPKRIQSILIAADEVSSGDTVIKQVVSWTKAVSAAVSRLKEEFREFPDVVEPFAMALDQIIHGVNSVVWLKLQMQGNVISLVEFVKNLVQFPFFTSATHGYLQWVKLLISVATSGIKGVTPDQWPRVQKRIILVAIGTCQASVEILSEFPPSWRDTVWSLLDLCWSLWLQCEEEERRKAQEKESLYRYQSKLHTIADSEDTMERLQLQALFPSFESDFLSQDEFSADCDDDPKDHEQHLPAVRSQLQFSPEEMEQISSLHRWACDKWYRTAGVPPEATPLPLREAYYLAGDIYRTAGSLPGYGCDYYMVGGHARAWGEALNDLQKGSSQGDRRLTNIYKDSAESEAQRALSVITDLRTKIGELLLEWPEHPGLKQINMACEKVLSLDVHEPLMKILTGLEYVLRKAQDWEAFASSRVSLGNELESLTHLILDWRKIELNSWKGLLLACAEEMKTDCGRWWFHLKSLCHSQTMEGDQPDMQDFTAAIQKFVETSTVGEFSHRLHLLKSFSLEMLQKGCTNISYMLDNTFHFYSQFLPAVTATIQQLTGPLEKEFKEYLMILRWNDGNYWAVKATTEKSHRTVVKFVNKYKGVLQQPVGPLLTDTSLEDGKDREESCREGALEDLVHLLRKQSYLSSAQVQDTIAIQVDGENADTTTGDAFVRMQQLVQRFTAPDICLQLNTNVDDFTGEVIEIHDSLKSTECLRELKGEKRKAAIKLSNTQKRKAVSDLFRALKQQGLSYRKGDDHSEGFKLFAFKLPTLEPAREESCVAKLLDDVHKRYYCCLARMGSFQTAVAKPSKELTLGLVSRCKGYAYYLMTLVCEQRIVLAEAVCSSCDLKHAVDHFEVLVKDRSCIEATEEFIHWQSSLSTCLEQSLEGIYSFSSLVSAMPEKLDFSLTPLAKESLPPIVACGDKVVAREAATILMSHMQDLKHLYTTAVRKEKDCRRWPPHFITRLALGELQKGFAAVEKFVQSISEVFALTVGKTQCLGMLEFLGALQKQLSTECKGFAEWLETVEHSIPVSILTPCESAQSSYSDQVNKMTKMILLAVQRVMNRHRGSEMDMNEGIASCKHLHSTVMDNLIDMKAHELLSEIESLLQATPQQEITSALKMLSAVHPLLHQYSKLYEKLLSDLVVAHQTLCKLLSALLHLFSTLATKGFCTPPEETEAEESGGTQMVDMEAGGFDEGEGDKNVSCDVEPSNLDDLESRKREQGERNEFEHEEEDVKMSADFNGTLEDVEEGEEQSEGEEDDEKEMGDLGSGDAEQLDRNMWAPDEKEDKQKLDELDKQETGEGTAIEEETKIVAKDGEQESTEFQPRKSLQAGDEEMEPDEELEPDEGEGVAPNEDFHALPQLTEESDTDVPEFTDLDLDAGEDLSGDGEESEGFVEPTAGELQESDEEYNEDDLTSDKGNLPKDVNTEIEDKAYSTADTTSYTGVDANALQTSDDLNCGTHDDKEAQDESQGPSTGSSTKLNGEGGSGISGLPMPEEELAEETGSALQRKPLGRHHDDYTLDDSEERAIKRPKLMESDHSQMESSEMLKRRKESALHRHMSANSRREHDAVAWDAALMEHFKPLADEKEASFKACEDEDEEMDVTDIQAMDQPPPHQLSSEVAADNKHPLPEAKKSGTEPDNSATRQQWDVYSKESFIGAANLQFLEPIQALDDNSVRESLKSAVSVLHSEQQSVDASQLWLKYEALTSSLSQSLCEELRIILQPTQAAQLKGDYRTGKRLNMRRIIPYIASRFQNDRIWLRRAKQTKRVYQILIAVDDSSSMNENDCNQMAYESLALISTSLSRLDCGQLGICRFGETVEVLHPLDQPFSTSSGGFVLQNLNFAQTKTNFKQLLEAAQSIFADYLSQPTRSRSSPEISQLLVVLSDGRGVFADGTLAVGLAMRRLNEMGVFTVFVILDSLFKDSVVDIKVPTFSKGKQPVIRTYLETFPFPFYIVLRDINTLPIVLGQALRQWFELVITRTSAL